MEKPRVSSTWKRATSGSCERSGLGANETLSTTSRFGSETCATEIAWPPPPVAGAMRSVSAVVASAEPRLFFAVTLARIVLAASAEGGAEVPAVAPAPGGGCDEVGLRRRRERGAAAVLRRHVGADRVADVSGGEDVGPAVR